MRHWAFFRQHVAILTYHAVVRNPLPLPDSCFMDGQTFAAQMHYLRRHFDVIPLREVAERLAAGRVRRPTAVITFDDGYRNNYDVAWPILQEAGLPATIFLVSDLIGTDRVIWSWRLHRAIAETRRTELTWDGVTYDLRAAAARTRAATALKKRLKALHPYRLEDRLAGLVEELGDRPDRPAAPDSPFRMLDREQVAAMSRSGLIDFGAHTCSHAILSHLNEQDLQREIGGSVGAVADLLGKPCTLFAYPNGRSADYTPAAVHALAASGVRTAVTTVAKQNDARTPPLELGRYAMPAWMSLREFEATVHHGLLPMRGAA